MTLQSKEQAEETRLAVMATDIGYMKSKVDSIDKKVDGLTSLYVLKAEFQPVKWLVYGITGLLLTGVVGALLALLFKK